MNKKLIALAVAGAASSAVFAAGNEVVLYGQVNVGMVFDNHLEPVICPVGCGRPDVSQFRVVNLATNSRIGFKGTEDLGNGLASFFKIETGVAPDNNAQSGSFASREGWVGLKGGFGSVGLGRGKHPYQLAMEDFDLFDGYDGATLNFDAIDGGVGSTPGTVRSNNTIKYDSPDLSGLTFSASYGTGENKTAKQSATSLVSLSAKYTMGDLFVEGAYANNDNEAVNGVAGTTKKQGYVLGAGYTMGDFFVEGAFDHTKDDSTKRDRWMLGASYTMGAATLKGGYVSGSKLKNNGGNIPDSQYDHFIIGSRYELSKRTALIAEFVQFQFKNEAAAATYGTSKKSPNALTLGVMHAF